jgi:hypothetical protein
MAYTTPISSVKARHGGRKGAQKKRPGAMARHGKKMETLGIEPRLITDRIEEMRSNCRNHLTISPLTLNQVNKNEFQTGFINPCCKSSPVMPCRPLAFIVPSRVSSRVNTSRVKSAF